MKTTLVGMWFVLSDGRHAQVDQMVGHDHLLALVSMEPTKSYQLRLFKITDLKKATFFHKLSDAIKHSAQMSEKSKVDKAKAMPPEPPAGDAYQPAR